MWCLALATSDCLLLADINPLNAELNPIRHLLALARARHFVHVSRIRVNPLNAELNPIRHLLALLGARHFVHVSRVRVKHGMNIYLNFEVPMAVSISFMVSLVITQ